MLLQGAALRDVPDGLLVQSVAGSSAFRVMEAAWGVDAQNSVLVLVRVLSS